MKNIVICLLKLICFPSLIIAASFQQISDIGSSARMIGLGHVQGFSSDASSIFENPAGFFRFKKGSVSFFSTTLMNEVAYNSVALGVDTSWGKFGLGYFDVGVKGIDETGMMPGSSVSEHVSIGQFDYKNSVFKLAYQNQFLDSLYWGTAFSLYQHRYYTVSGSGYDMDFGVIYEKADRYAVSLVAKNILPASSVSYNQGDSELIPFSLIISGAAPILSSQLTGLNLYTQCAFQQQHVLPAMAVGYQPSFISFMEFSLGYSQHLSYTLEKKNKWSMGVGFSFKGVGLHYAYEQNEYVLMDSNHYFSIQYSF